MLGIKDVNLLCAQNEGLKAQNKSLQRLLNEIKKVAETEKTSEGCKKILHLITG